MTVVKKNFLVTTKTSEQIQTLRWAAVSSFVTRLNEREQVIKRRGRKEKERGKETERATQDPNSRSNI